MTIAGALIGTLAVGGLTKAWNLLSGGNQDIGQQVEHVRSKAIASGENVGYHQRLQLRPGVESQVFVLQPARQHVAVRSVGLRRRLRLVRRLFHLLRRHFDHN